VASPVFFDLASAERIAVAVRKVEIGDRAEAALRFRRVVTPQQPKAVFHVATFPGGWDVGSPKVVTLMNHTGTPKTVAAVNVFANVAAFTTAQPVAIAREGTVWHAIEFLPEFRVATFAGPWSIAASKTVTLKYQTTTPNTVTAVNLFADVPDPGPGGDCAIARQGTAWFLIAAVCVTAS